MRRRKVGCRHTPPTMKALRYHTPNLSSQNFINYCRLHYCSVRAFFWKIIQPQLTDLFVRRRSSTQASHL